MTLRQLFLILVGIITLHGCVNNDNGNGLNKADAPWHEKRKQIEDSLKFSNNYIDSLICLNRFAHRDISHGAKSLYYDSLVTSNGDYYAWNAAKWYNYVEKDSITVFCAGHATFFHSLVREFMDENQVAHGYSIGIPNQVIGHYLSLIISMDGGKSRMHLIDPMFNGIYVLNNGTVADLRHLLYLIRSRRTDLFQIATFADQSSYLMGSKTEIDSTNPTYDLSFPYHFETSKNDSYPIKLRAKRTLDHYLNSGFSETYQRIAAYHNGFQLPYENMAQFKNCLLYRKAIYGPYKEQIDKELEYYQTAPLKKLDELFGEHGLSVKDLSQ